ncbi:hypothetical protein [Vibrio sp. HN007]|uniref:hypothetical protein n=1 Tax=Vibrio iocasae TaxID=3098914 RepID=UPI0035D41825
MSTFEQSLLEDTIELIKQRFNKGDTAQQHEILIQLDPIAKKLELVQVYRPQEEVLADLKEAIDNGGDRARDFFAHSFASWYRSGMTKRTSQLHEWLNLDMSNRRLFLEMLSLRDLGRFDDEALYQFEQYCLSVIGK